MKLKNDLGNSRPWHIIPDDNVAGAQRRDEEVLDIGFQRVAIQGSFDPHRGLHTAQCLPRRAFQTAPEFKRYVQNEPTIIFDGLEQRLQHPQDKEAQRDFYSGKKKCHTVKALTLTHPRRRILYLSECWVGKTQDYGMFQREFPPSQAWFTEVRVRVDLVSVRKLETKGRESTGQTKQGIATLGQFLPIDNQAAKAIKPSVRACDHPAARLPARMQRGVVRSPARRGNVGDIIFTAEPLPCRFIVIRRIPTPVLRRNHCRTWPHHGVIGE